MATRAGDIVFVRRAGGFALALTQPCYAPATVLIASLHPVGSIPRTGGEVLLHASETEGMGEALVALWNSRRALVEDLSGTGKAIPPAALTEVLDALDSLEMDEPSASDRVQRALLADLDVEAAAAIQRQTTAQWQPVTDALLTDVADHQAGNEADDFDPYASYSLDLSQPSASASPGRWILRNPEGLQRCA